LLCAAPGKIRLVMKIVRSHIASFAAIRALAIQCHALDVSAGELLFAGTHADKDERTKAAYAEQFAASLLSLAIALRTKFYDGVNPRSTIPYVAHCGVLFANRDFTEEPIEFSMKEACEKIIDALTIEKDLGEEIEKATTTFCGRDCDGVQWEFSISVRLFAEAVLNWVRDMEGAQPAVSDTQSGIGLPSSAQV